MNKHVTSLELSKKLKELGVKQESEFYHAGDKRIIANEVKKLFPVLFSAFLSSEIGEMLPEYQTTWKSSEKFGLGWHCNDDNQEEEYHQTANTEANARALMLIYLIENNLI